MPDGVSGVARSTTVLAALLAAATLAVLFVATTRPSHPFPQPPARERTVSPVSVSPTGHDVTSTRRSRHEDGGNDVATLIVIGVLLVLAVVLGSRRLRRPEVWGRHTRRRRPGPAPPPEADTTATAVFDGVMAAVDDALERDPGARSIIACWVALEDSLTSAGFPRQPAETSTDYVERILSAHGVDADPLRRLGALYREARFSSHALSDAQREDAHAALVRLRADLGRGARAR